MNKDVHQASQKVIEPLHSLVIRSVIFNLLITLLITSVRDMLSRSEGGLSPLHVSWIFRLRSGVKCPNMHK